MKTFITTTTYQIKNNLRSRWFYLYFSLFFLISHFSLQFSDDISKFSINLMSANIFIVPLVSVIYGTLFFYNNVDYIIFILTQPVNRKTIFLSLFLGLSLPMITGFLLGTALPLIYSPILSGSTYILFLLFISGIFLHLIFIAAAVLIAITNDNKLRGFGIAISFWLILTIIYDALFLFLLNNFSDYPLEYFSIIASLLNPVDISRIFVTLQLDTSALLGYTGAVFQNFFNGITGLILPLLTMLIWFITFFILGLKNFTKKDF